MSDYKTVTVSREGAVATVTLNRPDNLNAFNNDLREDVLRAAREVNNDDSIAVVVLTGAGRTFCAGADLAEQLDIPAHETAGQSTADQLNLQYKPAILEIANANKIWIAAANGVCAGVGSALVLTCDLVVMAEDASMYQAFAAIGLVPDGGASWHLSRILGPKRAMEMILSGEKMRADKCLALGMCNRVVPAEELVQAAQDWALELSGKAPLAMRYSKEAVAFATENHLADAISNEARLQSICVDSEDFIEGVTAFMKKRKPQWKGR